MNNILENLRVFITNKVYEAKQNGKDNIILKIDDLEKFGYVHKIHGDLLEKMILEPVYHMKIYSNSKNWNDKRFMIFWGNGDDVNEITRAS